MAKIKLVASDLDGTFLRADDDPHPENIRAVAACQQAGIRVCMFTGRNWTRARHIYQQSGFDRFCVLNNGAVIYDAVSDEIRYRNRFDPASIQGIVEVIQSYPDADYWFTGFEYISMVKAHGAPWYTCMDETEQREKGVRFYPDAASLIEATKEDIMRINWELPYDDMAQEVLEKLSAFTEVDIVSAEDYSLELTHKDSNKSGGLMVLADIYGVQPQDILAIGDSYNDIMMLAWAGTGVAMGNADQRLKDLADHVTDTNVNAGVAQAIYQIALQQ